MSCFCRSTSCTKEMPWAQMSGRGTKSLFGTYEMPTRGGCQPLCACGSQTKSLLFKGWSTGWDVAAVFFDLHNAFDSVPHKTLIDKLEQTGVNPHVLRWITDYLTNREQKVVVNGECSFSKTVLSGVPVLRPLLFLIYVDDLACLPLTDGSQCVLYADDLLPVKDQVDIQHLQNDVTSRRMDTT